MKTFFFDTETTGLNPEYNDIIQIAGIIDIDGDIVDEFSYQCKAYAPENIRDEALKVTGYTREEIAEFNSPISVLTCVENVFDAHVNKYDKADKMCPAGHNVKFDIEMLDQFFKKGGNKYGIGSYMTWQPLDTMIIGMLLKYMGLINPLSMKLKDLCDAVGVTGATHDALDDIRATRKCFLAMIDLINQK